MDTNRLVLQLTKDSSISLCVLETFDNDFKLFNSAYDTSNNLKMKDYCYMNAGDKFVTYSNQIRSSQLTVYINYFYNSAGERVKKLTRKGSKIEVTIYLDGGMFEISYSKTLEGTIDSNRYYNTLKISDASTSLSTGGSLIATIRVGKNVDDTTPPLKYILGDHLNNNTVTLGENGLLINREEYYPFGETSFGSFKFKRYRYNGKEKDSESGLYEYGQRYYAPWLCRFVSVDPVAESYPQLSSYNYAGNKPITSPDIEGLQGTEDNKVITDGAGREAIIDPGAEIVEADTAVISQEGDKYVNVNGVGLVKESHLRYQNIIPVFNNQKNEIQNPENKRKWWHRLFSWLPSLQGSGDKSQFVSSGLTHVSEDATEINNSGIEGNEVVGHIEIDALQWLLRGTPGKLNFKPSNYVEALSSGTDMLQEILNEEKPDYDIPLAPEQIEKKELKSLEIQSGQYFQYSDSVIVTTKKGEVLRQSRKNISNNNILHRPWRNGWMQTDTIINIEPIYK